MALIVKLPESNSWAQLDKEPLDWYLKFITFYLPGVIESGDALQGAYYNFLIAAGKRTGALNTLKVPQPWAKAHSDFQWKQRGIDFKRAQASEIVRQEAELIFDIIKKRIELVQFDTERTGYLAHQFDQAYHGTLLGFKRPIDTLNCIKAAQALTENNQLAINLLTELTGIKELLLEKEKQLKAAGE
jgi:hypothetical protein